MQGSVLGSVQGSVGPGGTPLIVVRQPSLTLYVYGGLCPPYPVQCAQDAYN